MEIVSGIQKFESAFASFSDSFIVIGGSACRAVLSDGPIQPRRTRDIDMVLVLENVGKDFIGAFWKFIKDGGYKFASRKNAEGEIKYVFYNFVGGAEGYPSQIEILSKPVEGIGQPADYLKTAAVAKITFFFADVNANMDFFHNLHCFFSGQWNVDPSPTNLIETKDILIQVLDQRAGRGKKLIGSYPFALIENRQAPLSFS